MQERSHYRIYSIPCFGIQPGISTSNCSKYTYYNRNLTRWLSVSSGRSPSQGNLTGSARKVKDGTADWYNSVQKWNNYNRQGLALIKLICNMKLEFRYSIGLFTAYINIISKGSHEMTNYFSYAENEADDSTQDSPGWSPKLQEICEKLTSVLNSMVNET